jgi:hypothetical protein
MSYQETTTQIIKDSIKSAIFIDENARPFYSPASEKEILEEMMSEELYSSFKTDGITLDIHKFNEGDEDKIEVTNYLFERRDLILLDWKLTGNSGELLSLKLLSSIVKKEHIHFCAIYTKQEELDEIFWNVLSYFSDKNTEYFDELKLELADVEEEVTQLIPEIKNFSANRFKKSIGREIGQFFVKNKELISRISEATKEKDRLCACILAGIAFSDEYTSEIPLPCPTMISPDRRTITLNSTIITILNKEANKPEVLINNFSKQISESKYSFLQLLGLEAHKIFSKRAAFIDTDILAISKEAFLFHRQQKKDDGFSEFIKEVLIEKARLNFRGEKISLLDDKLLDEISEEKLPPILQDEMLAMNIFYNSVHLGGNRKLNFGDVFKSETRFFICITALCDCQTPKNNMFYFAEGKIISSKKALGLGDSAFISYLPSRDIVRWSDDQPEESAHFKPIYIKPIQFIVPNNIITDNKLEMYYLNLDAIKESIEVEYVTTIKQNYTQRIANHAFAHPIRVGIDFVKKE